MAISFVNEAHSANDTSSPITVSVPSGVLNGDVMVAMIEQLQPRVDLFGSTTITDPSGWTLIGETVSDPGSGARDVPKVRTLIRVASGEPASYDWTWTGGGSAPNTNAIIAAYRGVDNTTPQDATFTSATDTNVGATVTDPAAIVTATDGAVVLTAPDSSDVASSPTYASAPTNQTDRLRLQQATFADSTVPSAGPFNPTTYALTVSGRWTVHTIALRPYVTPGPPWDSVADSPEPLAGPFAPGRPEGVWA